MKAKSGNQKGTIAPKNKTAEDFTINQWMEIFRKIYEDVDSKRTPVQMWVAATSHFTAMGEAIRRMHFSDLMLAATHAFCWMCSFVMKCNSEKGTVFTLNESFSALVACKYPLVCGHCHERPCHCNPKRMDEKSDKAARYQELLNLRAKLADAPDTYGVYQWLEVFNDIYGRLIHMLTLESIGFHFLEEAGEELTAIRSLMQLQRAPDENIEGIDKAFLTKLSTFGGVVELYEKYAGQKPETHKQDAEAIKARLVHAKVEMFIEFADTFSWFCSILYKIMSIAKNCKDDNCSFVQPAFRERLLQEYLPEGTPQCPSCKECPCKCVFYN